MAAYTGGANKSCQYSAVQGKISGARRSLCGRASGVRHDSACGGEFSVMDRLAEAMGFFTENTQELTEEQKTFLPGTEWRLAMKFQWHMVP